MKSVLRPILWACWARFEELGARSYIVGPELEDALQASRRLANMQRSATICYWTADEETPQKVSIAYLRAIEALSREKLDCYLSIKAPSVAFDPQVLTGLFQSGRRYGVRLHFDSLAPDTADKTFALIAQALPQYSDLGCTLPGRWYRSQNDADWAVERRLRVRVVKGQWADTIKPEMDMRKGFLAIIDRLAGRAGHVAVATHDAALAYEALNRLQRAKTPCELELLYGLPLEPVSRVAQAAGVKIRMYLPYGHAWLPYNISQVYENPRILWWMLRDLWGRRCN